MDTNFSRDASSFTLMERGLGSYCLRAILASCMALAIFTGPSLAWATDSHANPQASRHRLINQQRIQELKERIADLRQQLKNGSSSTSSTTASSLESLQTKVTSLESSVSALVTANTTLLTTLQAAQAQIAALEAKIATLESKPAGGVPDLEKYVSIDPNPMNGVNGPHIIFKGVNVHVLSGLGATADTTTGLGNLIIGYNEPDPLVGQTLRNGSHNLVGGRMNYFPSFGGVVFGANNRITGQYSAVLGGGQNNAGGQFSTVYGGQLNTSPTPYSFSPDQSGGACLGC